HEKRVFLVLAMAQEPDLMFLIEPFVDMYATTAKTIIGILKTLRDNGKTVIVVHHDLSKAEEYFDDLILINEKLIDFGHTKKVLDPETITKAYQSKMPFLQTAGVGV